MDHQSPPDTRLGMRDSREEAGCHRPEQGYVPSESRDWRAPLSQDRTWQPMQYEDNRLNGHGRPSAVTRSFLQETDLEWPRIHKAKNLFKNYPHGEPVSDARYPEGKGQIVSGKHGLYRKRRDSYFSSLSSQEMEPFIAFQKRLDAGKEKSWWSFHQNVLDPFDEDKTYPVSLKASVAAQHTVKKGEFEELRRVEKSKGKLWLLERHPVLELLTDGEQKQLIDWWKSHSPQASETPSTFKDRVKKKARGFGQNIKKFKFSRKKPMSQEQREKQMDRRRRRAGPVDYGSQLRDMDDLKAWQALKAAKRATKRKDAIEAARLNKQPRPSYSSVSDPEFYR